MTPYNPNSPSSRQELAYSVLALMEKSGFTPLEIPGTNEAVYAREVEGTGGRIKVLVYTSVEQGVNGPIIRACGTDAIRASAVYFPGAGARERGLGSETRVHRVGKIEDITERLLERMRSVYKNAKAGERCKSCGAPKFLSRNKNLVCADVCWTRGSSRTPTQNQASA